MAEGSSSGNPRRIRRITSLRSSLPRLTFCRNMYLHSTTIPQPRSSHSQTNPNHDSTILRVESKNDFDSTIPHPIFSNHNSTTRKRIREAVSESSSSWNLGEYAVSIRPGLRSTASLPPHQSRQIRRVHNMLPTLQDAIDYIPTQPQPCRALRHL